MAQPIQARLGVGIRMHPERREVRQATSEANLRGTAELRTISRMHHESAERLKALGVQDALPFLSLKPRSVVRG